MKCSGTKGISACARVCPNQSPATCAPFDEDVTSGAFVTRDGGRERMNGQPRPLTLANDLGLFIGEGHCVCADNFLDVEAPAMDNSAWKVGKSGRSLKQVVDAGKASASNFFDVVYGPNSTINQLYDDYIREIVLSAMEGHNNGLVLAYEQSSTGKAHTMMGALPGEDDHEHSKSGIVPLAVNDCLRHVKEMVGKQQFHLQLSFQELRGEEVHDLLAPKTKAEWAVKGSNVESQNLPNQEGSTSTSCCCHEDRTVEVPEQKRAQRTTSSLLAEGQACRTEGCHAIVRLDIQSWPSSDAAYVTEPKRISSLTLVDLSNGSNDFLSSKSELMRMVLPNQSDGDCHICVICTLSPLHQNMESSRTLNVAAKCRRIGHQSGHHTTELEELKKSFSDSREKERPPHIIHRKEEPSMEMEYKPLPELLEEEYNTKIQNMKKKLRDVEEYKRKLQRAEDEAAAHREENAILKKDLAKARSKAEQGHSFSAKPSVAKMTTVAEPMGPFKDIQDDDAPRTPTGPREPATRPDLLIPSLCQTPVSVTPTSQKSQGLTRTYHDSKAETLDEAVHCVNRAIKCVLGVSTNSGKEGGIESFPHFVSLPFVKFAPVAPLSSHDVSGVRTMKREEKSGTAIIAANTVSEIPGDRGKAINGLTLGMTVGGTELSPGKTDRTQSKKEKGAKSVLATIPLLTEHSVTAKFCRPIENMGDIDDKGQSRRLASGTMDLREVSSIASATFVTASASYASNSYANNSVATDEWKPVGATREVLDCSSVTSESISDVSGCGSVITEESWKPTGAMKELFDAYSVESISLSEDDGDENNYGWTGGTKMSLEEYNYLADGPTLARGSKTAVLNGDGDELSRAWMPAGDREVLLGDDASTTSSSTWDTFQSLQSQRIEHDSSRDKNRIDNCKFTHSTTAESSTPLQLPLSRDATKPIAVVWELCKIHGLLCSMLERKDGYLAS